MHPFRYQQVLSRGSWIQFIILLLFYLFRADGPLLPYVLFAGLVPRPDRSTDFTAAVAALLFIVTRVYRTGSRVFM